MNFCTFIENLETHKCTQCTRKTSFNYLPKNIVIRIIRESCNEATINQTQNSKTSSKIKIAFNTTTLKMKLILTKIANERSR